jgi:hypothetical protein
MLPMPEPEQFSTRPQGRRKKKQTLAAPEAINRTPLNEIKETPLTKSSEYCNDLTDRNSGECARNCAHRALLSIRPEKIDTSRAFRMDL